MVSGSTFHFHQSPRLRPARYILTAVFEQIIGHQDHRGLGEKFFGDGFAPDPFLERVEAQRGFIGEGQHLAVDDRAVGQVVAQLRQLGKAVCHQVFAARPHMMFAAAQDELPTDTIPFALGCPIGGCL